jgi:hypothetical protein
VSHWLESPRTWGLGVAMARTERDIIDKRRTNILWGVKDEFELGKSVRQGADGRLELRKVE